MERQVKRARRALEDGTFATVSSCVVALSDERGGTPRAGCAVFATSTDIALTCFHCIKEGATEIFGVTPSGQRIDFTVGNHDEGLDYAVLHVTKDERPQNQRTFLELSNDSVAVSEELLVIGFQLGIMEELGTHFRLSAGLAKAWVMKASEHHFLLQTTTFKGDSGAAVVLSDGRLVGIVAEGINEAAERVQQLEATTTDDATQQRLAQAEESIDYLVSACGTGSLALKVSAIVLH